MRRGTNKDYQEKDGEHEESEARDEVEHDDSDGDRGSEACRRSQAQLGITSKHKAEVRCTGADLEPGVRIRVAYPDGTLPASRTD